MRTWVGEKCKKLSLKDITSAIVIPLLAACPWLVILATPIPPFLDINHQNTEPLVEDWEIILIFYLIYLFASRRLRPLFNAFTFSSCASLILGSIRGFFFAEDCSDKFCLNLINNYFGLGCIDIQGGCAVEFFLISFFILFFTVGLFLMKYSRGSQLNER